MTPTADDPEHDQAQRWSAVADGWARWAPALDTATADLDRQLLDAAAVSAGLRVVDLACGTGEPALSAARRVGPEGAVVGLDFAASMVAVAARRADAAAMPWLTFRCGDAGEAAAPGPVHDAALCRFGMMHFDDPAATLATLRDALRPGARLACAVWGRAEEVPFLHHARLVGVRLGLLAPPGPEPREGPFRFGDPHVAAEVLRAAGFEAVRTSAVSVPLCFPSPDDYVAFLLDVSQVIRGAADAADAPTRRRFLAELAAVAAATGTTAGDQANDASTRPCFDNTARIVSGHKP